METKRMGKQTVRLTLQPSIAAAACVGGRKESQGPLRRYFDYLSEDSRFGAKSWEQAESAMLKMCYAIACDKAGTPPGDVEYVLSGDLLNQCAGSAYAMRECGVPYLGLYGACSTMAEGLSLAAMLIDGGFCTVAAAATSSHFCSAERQYRYPLQYGSQRPPTAQRTVTGAGAAILKAEGPAPYITHITTGIIADAGVTDMNNMGAAMAPAAYDTLTAHFRDTGRAPDYYDAIVTGDLGVVGSDILRDLFRRDGVDLGVRYMDCGRLIYAIEGQDAHSGGSGCGCSAAVLCGHLLHGMLEGNWNRLLFAATGAMMSPTTNQQGESIPAICHAVALENGRC
ncbi:MAG: stage V sporulation protein AD [Oscillospiraceae bacterium]|nr:stage V sporulation protein AD [Oscillospiraceae bacterium]